jgi:hypothetical protein
MDDFIAASNVHEFADLFVFLADIMHLVQGDLQSWMGPALGSHIRRSYDSQQLWLSLIPMLSLLISLPPVDDSCPAFDVFGLLGQVVLPFTMLATKLVQKQPADHASIPAEAAPVSLSASGQAANKAEQHRDCRDLIAGAQPVSVTTTASSSNSTPTSNTAGPATDNASHTTPSSPSAVHTSSKDHSSSSSRKAQRRKGASDKSKAASAKSQELRTRLWEAITEDPQILPTLSFLAFCTDSELQDGHIGESYQLCVEYMLAACEEHVAPPGAMLQLADPSPVLALLKTTASEGDRAAAPDGLSAAPATQPVVPAETVKLVLWGFAHRLKPLITVGVDHRHTHPIQKFLRVK